MIIFLMFSITLLFQANASVIYAQEAMSRKIDGKVYLHILVDTLGYVADIRIDSSDHDVRSQSAINGVRGIRFAQSYIDGTHAHCLTTWLPLTITFNAISDSTKRSNYTITMERPPGESVVLDKPPALIKAASPIYPQEALNNNIEGRVIVEVQIDKNGNTQDAFVVETDKAIFNESALEVVGRFHFTPGIAHGQPVPVWVGIPIQYTLPKKK